MVGEVHAESRIGQNCVAFALAVRLGVGPEFELKAHICRFRYGVGVGVRTALLAVTLPPPV